MNRNVRRTAQKFWLAATVVALLGIVAAKGMQRLAVPIGYVVATLMFCLALTVALILAGTWRMYKALKEEQRKATERDMVNPSGNGRV